MLQCSPFKTAKVLEARSDFTRYLYAGRDHQLAPVASHVLVGYYQRAHTPQNDVDTPDLSDPHDRGPVMIERALFNT
jgi:hypothetical protein